MSHDKLGDGELRLVRNHLEAAAYALRNALHCAGNEQFFAEQINGLLAETNMVRNAILICKEQPRP